MTEPKTLVAFAIADEALKLGLWQVYETYFLNLPALSIERQGCYSHDDFMRIMSDADYVKFIILDDVGHPLGYLLATWSMDRLRQDYVFVDTERLEVLYPEAIRGGKMCYLTSMATPPHMSNRVIDLMVTYVVQHRMMIAFDYSLEKLPGFPGYAKHQFEKAVERHNLPVKSISYSEIGGQLYGAITAEYDE